MKVIWHHSALPLTLCCFKQDYVVLLDERGKAATSEGMAKLVAEVSWHGI